MAVDVGTIQATLELRDQMTAQLTAAGKKVETFRKNMGKTGQSIAQFGSSMQSAGSAFLPMSAAVAGLGTAAVTTFADFESGMNRVRAVTGATGQDFADLERTAIELGSTTVYTARDAAEAMGYFGLAGFRVNEIMGAMPGALNLAAAGQLEVGQAADITAKIMRGYGRDVSQVAEQNDILVRAFTKANTDLVQLGEAFKMAGPVANVAGLEFSETAAALSLMADAGFQGTLGGTALRAAIARLGGAVPQVTEKLKEMGIATHNTATGEMLPFVDILEQLEAAGLDAGEIMSLFGLRAGPAMAALIERGSASLRDFKHTLETDVTTAAGIAEVQLQGLKGEWVLMRSAVEGAGIEIGRTLAPAATQAVVMMRNLAIQVKENVVPAFNSLTPQTKTAVGTILTMAATAGPALLALGTAIRLVGFSMVGLSGIGVAMTGVFSKLAMAMGMTGGALTAMLAPALKIFAAFAVGWAIGDLIKDIKLFAGSVFTLGEAFEFGWVKLDNWMRGVKMTDDQIQEAIVSRRKLTKAQDDNTKSTDENAEGQQALADAIKEEYQAVVAAIGGTDDLSNSMTGGARSAGAMSDEVKQLVEQLSGRGLLKALEDTTAAIGHIGGAQKLTKDEMAAYVTQLQEVIAKYRQVGGADGDAVVEHYENLLAKLPLLGTSVQDMTDRFGSSIFGANTLGKGLRGLARESMGLRKDGLLPVRKDMDLFKLAMEAGAGTAGKFAEHNRTAAEEVLPSWTDALAPLPGALNSIFQSAFEGGGGAIGAIKSFATQALATLANMIPGVGPIISSFAGAIVAGFSKIFGGKGNREQLRQEWLERAAKKTEEDVETMLSALSSAFKELDSSGALVTDAFRDIMRDVERLGGSSELTAYKMSQLGRVGTGMAALLEGASVTTQGTANGLAAALSATFSSMVANGASAREAIAALSPAILNLQAQMEASGLTGSAAFQQIASMAAIAGSETAGPLLDAIHGATEAMAGLHNAGLLDQEMFAALAITAAETFQKMVDGGANGSDALRLIAPDLQRIWELQQEFGYEVDAATQKLIDQAVEAGLVGEAHKSAQKKVTDAMQAAATAMKEVADILKQMFEQAGDASEEFGARARNAVNSIPRNITTHHRIETEEITYGRYIPDDFDREMGYSEDTGIPAFAEGGTVRRTGLALVHQGERVVPAEKGDDWSGGDGASFDLLAAEVAGLRRDMKRMPYMIRDALITRGAG